MDGFDVFENIKEFAALLICVGVCLLVLVLIIAWVLA